MILEWKYIDDNIISIRLFHNVFDYQILRRNTLIGLTFYLSDHQKSNPVPCAAEAENVLERLDRVSSIAVGAAEVCPCGIRLRV